MTAPPHCPVSANQTHGLGEVCHCKVMKCIVWGPVNNYEEGGYKKAEAQVKFYPTKRGGAEKGLAML